MQIFCLILLLQDIALSMIPWLQHIGNLILYFFTVLWHCFVSAQEPKVIDIVLTADRKLTRGTTFLLPFVSLIVFGLLQLSVFLIV